jgi:hypothetical protein
VTGLEDKVFNEALKPVGGMYQAFLGTTIESISSWAKTRKLNKQVSPENYLEVESGMGKILRMFIMLSMCTLFSVSAEENASSNGDVYVNGYTRSDGTYVAPHYRSSPDSKININWSTKGNVNPYTGAEGTKKRYSESVNISQGSFQSKRDTELYINAPQEAINTLSFGRGSGEVDYGTVWIGLFVVFVFLLFCVSRVRDVLALYREVRTVFYFDATWMSAAVILLILIVVFI